MPPELPLLFRLFRLLHCRINERDDKKQTKNGWKNKQKTAKENHLQRIPKATKEKNKKQKYKKRKAKKEGESGQDLWTVLHVPHVWKSFDAKAQKFPKAKEWRPVFREFIWK